jgi:hypothetical protein
MHGRCSIMLPPRRCADPGFTPVPGQPPQRRRGCVVTPPRRFPVVSLRPVARDCRHCPQATVGSGWPCRSDRLPGSRSEGAGHRAPARHTDVRLGVSAPPAVTGASTPCRRYRPEPGDDP